jgi:hypothetical protein
LGIISTWQRLSTPPIPTGPLHELDQTRCARSGSDVTTATLRQIAHDIASALVARDYAAIETLTRRRRLSAEAMTTAVNQYGRTLIMPPPEEFEKLDCVEVRGANPRTFGIRFDLWTKEEGRSDLTLEFTVRGNDDSYEVEVDDLHVL